MTPRGLRMQRSRFMEFRLSEEQEKIHRNVREVCGQYPDEYWRELDRERRYPEEFVRALTEARWLGVLIPEEYGGLGLGVIEASIILERVMNLGKNRIEMRIPRSTWFLRDLRFPHT